MVLPTRQNFMSTGLTGVSNTTDACSICLDQPMNSPVQLSCCKNTWCKACISEWLSDSNSCPLCRTALYNNNNNFAATGQGPLVPDNDRHQRAVRALRASGLGDLGQALFPDSASFSTVETFGGRVPFTGRTQLMPAAAAAFQAVSFNEIPAHSGAVWVQTTLLGPHLIAMSNLLNHFATSQGRPYGAVRAGAWNQIVMSVWSALQMHEGRTVDSTALPGLLMQSVRRNFQGADGAIGEFLGSNEALCSDLDFLVNYMVEQARFGPPRAAARPAATAAPRARRSRMTAPSTHFADSHHTTHTSFGGGSEYSTHTTLGAGSRQSENGTHGAGSRHRSGRSRHPDVMIHGNAEMDCTVM